MFNKVIMVGNLTRNIELKYLPTGSAIAKSAIATSYKYKSTTSEQKDEVCFLVCKKREHLNTVSENT